MRALLGYIYIFYSTPLSPNLFKSIMVSIDHMSLCDSVHDAFVNLVGEAYNEHCVLHAEK